MTLSVIFLLLLLFEALLHLVLHVLGRHAIDKGLVLPEVFQVFQLLYVLRLEVGAQLIEGLDFQLLLLLLLGLILSQLDRSSAV